MRVFTPNAKMRCRAAPQTLAALSKAAIRPSVCLSVCLSVWMHLAQKMCPCGQYLRQNTKWKPHGGSRTVWSAWPERQRRRVAGAASEAFARWLHHQYALNRRRRGNIIVSPRDTLLLMELAPRGPCSGDDLMMEDVSNGRAWAGQGRARRYIR